MTSRGPLIRWTVIGIGLAALAISVWLTVSDRGSAPPEAAAGAPENLPAILPTDCRFPTGGLPTDCYDAYLSASRPVAGSEEEGKAVRLHIAVVPAAQPSGADPVVFLHGGPASPATTAFVPMVGKGFRQMYGGRDIVVFDQRGSGTALPRLDCPAEPSYAVSLSADARESLLEWLAEAARPCLAAHDAGGVDLASYTVDAVVADIADIVALLGYESVGLHGSSFGSRLGLTYAAVAPGTLHAAVLEGPYPPSVDGVARRGEAAMSALRALFRACARTFTCNAAHPDLEGSLSRLLDRLDGDPVERSFDLGAHGVVRVVINPDRFIEILYRAMYSGVGMLEIPRLITEAGKGDFTLAGRWLSVVLDASGSVDAAAYFAVVCSTVTESTNASEATAALPRHFREYFARTAAATLRLCDEFGLRGRGTRVEPSDVPLVFLVGTYDPATPPDWSHAAAATYPNGHVAEFPYGTHSNLLAPRTCAAQVAADFMRDPSRPGQICLSAASPLRFSVDSP